MQLKLKAVHPLAKENQLRYATEGSAGLDLIAALDEEVHISPGETIMVPSGICMEIERGYEAQIRPRSGISSKGVMVAFGTVDSDYRGEVRVIMSNIGRSDFTISPGMRIAQMILSRYESAQIEYVDELSETKRGDGGFGSTGMF